MSNAYETVHGAIDEALWCYEDGPPIMTGELREEIGRITAETCEVLDPAPQIIRTVKELEALGAEAVVQRLPQHPGQYSRTETAGDLAYVVKRWGTNKHLPAVVIAPADQVRAAQKALEEA